MQTVSSQHSNHQTHWTLAHLTHLWWRVYFCTIHWRHPTKWHCCPGQPWRSESCQVTKPHNALVPRESHPCSVPVAPKPHIIISVGYSVLLCVCICVCEGVGGVEIKIIHILRGFKKQNLSVMATFKNFFLLTAQILEAVLIVLLSVACHVHLKPTVKKKKASPKIWHGQELMSHLH